MMAITTIKPNPSAPPLDEGVRPRLWSRQEYHRAAELGLFGPDERLELLDGEILKKMTVNPPHAFAVGRVFKLVAAAFGAGFHARQQQPLVLNDRSEPEPDVVVVVGEDGDYATDHPTAQHTRLLVEVADTTLHHDRTRKLPAYARAGIVEYWILNLVERQLEVYRSPSRGRYRDETIYKEGDTVSPQHAPDAVIRVADLLPPVTPEASPATPRRPRA
jgi:Uma2 family endonuclease